jgi:hypothetical protein
VSCGDVINVAPARLKACIYSLSCDPLAPTDTLSDCIAFGPQYQCNLTAQSCSDVTNCTGHKKEDASICLAGETTWKCSANVAVNCGASPPYSLNCGRTGGTCDVSHTTTDASVWPCRLSTPATCTDAAGAFICSSGNSYQCVGGKPYGQGCTSKGTCVQYDPTSGYCTDRTTTCPAGSQVGNVSCLNNSIQICDTGNRFASYDCAPSGGTCGVTGTSLAYCLEPGCTSADNDACAEDCTSSTVASVCVGGAPLAIDCTAYGFKECVKYINHPVTGKDYVECR